MWQRRLRVINFPPITMCNKKDGAWCGRSADLHIGLSADRFFM